MKLTLDIICEKKSVLYFLDYKYEILLLYFFTLLEHKIARKARNCNFIIDQSSFFETLLTKLIAKLPNSIYLFFLFIFFFV